MEGVIHEKRSEEETILKPFAKTKPKAPVVETKKPETKKTPAKKKKNTAVAPVVKMVNPYSTQQFFDQPANITNGQLLAMNPKFAQTVGKQLRKPVSRKKKEDQEDKAQEEEETPDLMAQSTLVRPNNSKSTALYCDASIKHIQFPLIIDSGSAGCIISLNLLRDLDMEITHASKTLMVNVNGEKRRPLGAVSDIPLKIQECIIPMEAIVTEADSYAAIIGNDWLRKVKAKVDYEEGLMSFKWNGKDIVAPVECQEMPHHAISIEVPEVEDEGKDQSKDEDGDEGEDEEEESEEEYETEDELQEQMYCFNQFITNEEAKKIEEELIEQTETEKEFFYQYEETEEGKFHTGNLNESQQAKFKDFMRNYHDLFAWNPDNFGRTSVITHSIDTGNAKPIKQRFYRTSYQNQLFIKEEIQRLLKAGLIKPSSSQWTSPVVVVEKKNGKKRLCVDYRKLNNATKKDCYPLPRIDDMLETLSGAQWFTSLDLASGFWQVELDPKDSEKSTFITKFGTFEFKVMPFGLCNAPATFQRLMDTVLRDILWQFVIVYIDDINVASKTFEEHLEHLKRVFDRLMKAGLKLSPEKCFFFKEELPFLGHVVSREGIHTDPEKLRVIKDFPIPRDLTQLRSFLALASYYRKFVKGFSAIAEPLNRLLKKGTPYAWTDDQQEAFEYLKLRLITPPILAYPDFERPFIIYTDASTYALGAILSQKDESKRERVIAYASRTLNKHERNYGITELECLAVVWAVKHFHHYLHGQKFTVITDHAALRYLKNMTNPVGKLGRWLMTLNGYDMEIINRPGRQHTNADTLSRIVQQ